MFPKFTPFSKTHSPALVQALPSHPGPGPASSLESGLPPMITHSRGSAKTHWHCSPLCSEPSHVSQQHSGQSQAPHWVSKALGLGPPTSAPHQACLPHHSLDPRHPAGGLPGALPFSHKQALLLGPRDKHSGQEWGSATKPGDQIQPSVFVNPIVTRHSLTCVSLRLLSYCDGRVEQSCLGRNGS